jgi:hypothetical protein
MARNLARLDQACRVAAVADPRADELKARGNPLRGTAFFKTADELLSADRYDGNMIGTRCSLHTEMARKVGPTWDPALSREADRRVFCEVRLLVRDEYAIEPIEWKCGFKRKSEETRCTTVTTPVCPVPNLCEYQAVT